MGLKNRFSGESKDVWAFWKSCIWCGEAGWNAVHHVISPSSMAWKKGKFNSSRLNGAPIHNDGCHLYNPKLHDQETEAKLLAKVMVAVLNSEAKITERDMEFIRAYRDSHYAKVYDALPVRARIVIDDCDAGGRGEELASDEREI